MKSICLKNVSCEGVESFEERMLEVSEGSKIGNECDEIPLKFKRC